MSTSSAADDPTQTPRAVNGRAPDVFHIGRWVPMRQYSENEEIDFAIVGTGAGGGTLACQLAEAGFSVVGFDAGPFWRPLEDFASDETEQAKLYWTDERIVDGANPLQLGRNNSGQAVGGSTVHFARCRCAFARNGSRRAAASATASTGRSNGGRCGTTTPRSSRR